MPTKQQSKKVYKTMQGKVIDMDMLRQKNELTPAVGNVRVNARGDELGPGGKIIKKKEEIAQALYGSVGKMKDENLVKSSKSNSFNDTTQSPKVESKETTTNKQSKSVSTKNTSVSETASKKVEDTTKEDDTKNA